MPPASGPPEEDVVARLRGVAAFAPMSDAALAALASLCRLVEFNAGDVLIRQSETLDVAFVLLDGEVAVTNETALGETRLALIAAPALVGEIAALAGTPRTATVKAVAAVRALRLPREALLAVARDNPDLMVSVVSQLARQIQGVNAALSIYAGGFEALERDDFDAALLEGLTNPSPEMRGFTEAFARLARRIAHERRNRGEMASAALIQKAMLPQALAGLDPLGRCDLFGDMVSARDVGGDLYDVFRLDDDHLALAVGDVCGKGVPASLFMSVTMTVLRLAAQAGGDVAATLLRANAMLYAQNPSALFVTLFYGVLDLRSGQLDYASCGHNPAYVVGGDRALRVLAGGGMPLGMFPDKTVRARRERLAAGETLLLYTDGVTESVDKDGREFGDERLAATLGDLGGLRSEAVCRSVMAAVADFSRGVDPFDDITCLAVRWDPDRKEA